MQSGFSSRAEDSQEKYPSRWMDIFLGEPKGIFLEHLFVDLFTLRDRFRDLGMVIEDGEVNLPELMEESLS